jgi:small-conductance mechanosensitive channel
VTFWGVGLLGFALALNLVGLRAVASGLQAGGGITAVVLGFAFREIGENLLAGFLR